MAQRLSGKDFDLNSLYPVGNGPRPVIPGFGRSSLQSSLNLAAPSPIQPPSDKVLDYLNSIDPPIAQGRFMLGKYKNVTYEEVEITNPSYFRFLLTKCDSENMQEDIFLLKNWLNQKLQS